jgi:hypothetical protein
VPDIGSSVSLTEGLNTHPAAWERMVDMSVLLAMSAHTGARLAEVGFLLILFAGVWLIAAEIPRLGLSRLRTIVAGVALAVAGLLLIIATHSGHFGQP